MTDDASSPARTPIRHRRMLQTGIGCFVAGGLAGGLVVGTVGGTGGTSKAAVTAPEVPTNPGVPGALEPPIRLTGALVSFDSCGAYLDYMRGRAESVVGPYGLQPAPYAERGLSPAAGVSAGGAMAASGVAGGPVPSGVATGAPANAAASSGTASSGTAASGTAASAGAGRAASSGSVAATPGLPSSSFSQTNDQVAGVDEPDTVKTDGRIVVTLEQSTLRVMDTSAHVLGTLTLPGDTGGGLLLSGNRVVVLSSPAPDIGGTAALPASGYRVPSPVGAQAQAAVVDLSDPAHPQLAGTFLFDGSVVAARLVDGQVRLVLRSDGPRLSFVTPSMNSDPAAATSANRALIAASTAADWLPAWQLQRPDGSTTARQPLTACDAVARPDQASGLSTVTVLSLDPAANAPGPGTSVVAAGSTVYATAEHLYVAGPAVNPGPAGTSGASVAPGAQIGCCSIVPPGGSSTRIYAFDTPTSGRASFEGEGTVPGWLLNSYAMDEDPAGRLRVASTWGDGSTTQSQITVLAPSAGRLADVGSVAGLGRGEFVRAVRFIGNQAYVVTFQSFDPLYVVDLSDPARPKVTGELDQPGFSEFLYPLPGQRLLGVGVELTGNEPSGLVVATYDVSDPAHPRRISESNLTSGFQYVQQGFDPHAFLYWPPADLALVAIPPSPWGGGYVGGPGVGAPGVPTVSSGVGAFHIDGGGSLSREATLSYGSLTATRSVVIGHTAWVTTPAGVITADLNNLTASQWHPY